MKKLCLLAIAALVFSAAGCRNNWCDNWFRGQYNPCAQQPMVAAPMAAPMTAPVVSECVAAPVCNPCAPAVGVPSM